MKKLRNTALAAVLALTSISSLACRFHVAGDNSQYPGSMLVYLRGIYAQQNDLIEPVDELEGEFGFRRASLWLRIMSDQLEQMGLKESYILLVDVPMWNQYNKSAFAKMSLDMKMPPEDGGVVLMTTQAGLHALISEKLGYSEALDEGVLMVRNDSGNQVEALLRQESS